MFLTYLKQLRTESEAAVIANLKRKGWKEAKQPAHDPATQECVWQDGKWAVQAKAFAPPPAQAWQVRAWMIRNGIDLATIPALIASATTAGPAREEALMRWEFVVNVPHDHPLVTAVAASLGVNIQTVWPDVLAIT